MEFTGEFETHLTLALNHEQEIAVLRTWASVHGLKCLHIVLARGQTPSQPMLTDHGRGTLSDTLQTAIVLSNTLKQEGFLVTRIKIEAAPWNQDVPQSTSEALNHPPDRYFEHHIKLLLADDTDIKPLTHIAEQHSAHLSRNALRVRSDLWHERFITQRCQAVGREEARQRLDALLAAIALLAIPVIEVEEEFVVYDNNLAIDAGWIG